VHLLLRWCEETQVGTREGLAIMVGGQDAEATRVLALIGLIERLPVVA
jgi:hypothetical protein